MNGPHIPLDHVLFVAMALLSPLVDRYAFYPWLKRSICKGIQGARVRGYLVAILTSWFYAASILALWVSRGRPWEALSLGPTPPLRLALGFAAALGFAGLGFAQWRAIATRPDRLKRVLKQFDDATPLMPRTPGERWGFSALSITAGICEEILFRGFVTWYFAVWTGLIPAILISAALFGFAHFYLGGAHVLRTAIVGLVFGLLVLASGSLWPAIIIHALQDLLAGDLGYRALSQTRVEPGEAGLAEA